MRRRLAGGAGLAAVLAAVFAGFLTAGPYEDAIARTRAKYGAAADVPAASVAWLAKTYGRDAAAIRAALAAPAGGATAPSGTRPDAQPAGPGDRATGGRAPATASGAASPDAAGVSEPPGSAAPPGSTSAPGAGLAAAAKQTAEAGLERVGIDPQSPWVPALARALFGSVLMTAAIFLWLAPRMAAHKAPQVQQPSTWSSLVVRLLALYMAAAGVWEIGGAVAPDRLPFGRPFTILREAEAPIRRWVEKAKVFRAVR